MKKSKRLEEFVKLIEQSNNQWIVTFKPSYPKIDHIKNYFSKQNVKWKESKMSTFLQQTNIIRTFF